MSRLLALVWPELRAPSGAAAPASSPASVFEPMLDALDDLSPRVEAVDQGVALVDVTGLGAFHGPERRIAARAVQLARGVAPLTVRCGIGDNRWLATLATRLAHPTRADAPAALHVMPPGPAASRAALSELPLALLPASAMARSRFVLFGLTRMGQLAELPRAAVGAQFGTEGERLHALARGEDPRPVVPRRRPERVVIDVPFEPAIEPGGLAFMVRRASADLCDELRTRHRAPGRASLELHMEDAAALALEVTLPQPALEPDWIARLLVSRLEVIVRERATPTATAADEESAGEHRITLLRLVFDRLSDPWTRQLPAFEPQAARWEELRWSLERMRSRFGPGRLWRAVPDRPYAARPERQARLVDIGLEADA